MKAMPREITGNVVGFLWHGVEVDFAGEPGELDIIAYDIFDTAAFEEAFDRGLDGKLPDLDQLVEEYYPELRELAEEDLAGQADYHRDAPYEYTGEE